MTNPNQGRGRLRTASSPEKLRKMAAYVRPSATPQCNVPHLFKLARCDPRRQISVHRPRQVAKGGT